MSIIIKKYLKIWKKRDVIFLIFIVFLLSLAPLAIKGYWLHVLIFALYYSVLASFWNLEAGYTGQFSFAYLAYAGIGAYTSALTVIYLGIPPTLGFLLSSCMAGLTGMFLGYITLKMRAVYLALTTITFSEILRIVLTAEYWLTRGALGLRVPPLFNVPFKEPYYYVMLGIFVLSIIMIYSIVNSKYGLFIRAIREDEYAASCMGLNTVRYRVMVTTVGAFFSGLVGAFYAHYILLISPNMIVFTEMAKVIAMSIIGGTRTITGPLIGAFLIEFLDEYLRTANPLINNFFIHYFNFSAYGEWRLLVLATILLAILRLMPKGIIIPLFRRIFTEMK